jgi:hypothetical protein
LRKLPPDLCKAQRLRWRVAGLPSGLGGRRGQFLGDDRLAISILSRFFVADDPVKISLCFKGDPVITFGQVGEDLLEDGAIDILELSGGVVPHLASRMVQ